MIFDFFHKNYIMLIWNHRYARTVSMFLIFFVCYILSIVELMVVIIIIRSEKHHSSRSTSYSRSNTQFISLNQESLIQTKKFF